jgi:putative chitinase
MGAIFTQKAFQDAAGISTELAAKWHAPLVAAMPLAEINTAERKAMFIAQCGHESGGFARTKESLNYTPAALLATWPGRFTDYDANQYGRIGAQKADEPAIARLAYGGRMGNDNVGDGYKYRGRGLIQITGKSNYGVFWAWLGVNERPETIDQMPEFAAASASWFWQANSLNKWADLCDVLTCSRVINLGSSTSRAKPNGLADRLERYNRAIKVMTGRA